MYLSSNARISVDGVNNTSFESELLSWFFPASLSQSPELIVLVDGVEGALSEANSLKEWDFGFGGAFDGHFFLSFKRAVGSFNGLGCFGNSGGGFSDLWGCFWSDRL